MLRQILIYVMILTLAVSTVACGGKSSNADNQTAGNQPVAQAPQNRLSDGDYPVQQATYDDGTGEYNLMLLNTKPGESSVYRTENLQMARLTDEEVQQGKTSSLRLANGQAALHLTEDFKIEYVHTVTENVTNPQTGQPETVVVRQQSSFWAPFAGALAGQAIGSLLFTPHYYFPPAYQPGGVMNGYGGYGRTYDQAVSNYRTRYNAEPNVVRNQTNFRTTGRLRTPSGQVKTTGTANRSTGSGFGSNTLRRSPSGTTKRTTPAARPRGFGSSRGMSRRR